MDNVRALIKALGYSASTISARHRIYPTPLLPLRCCCIAGTEYGEAVTITCPPEVLPLLSNLITPNTGYPDNLNYNHRSSGTVLVSNIRAPWASREVDVCR